MMHIGIILLLAGLGLIGYSLGEREEVAQIMLQAAAIAGFICYVGSLALGAWN